MNYGCDLTQFIMSSITFDINSDNLARRFISDTVLYFVMCLVVVLNNCRFFKNCFLDCVRPWKSYTGSSLNLNTKEEAYMSTKYF